VKNKTNVEKFYVRVTYFFVSSCLVSYVNFINNFS